MQPAAVLSIMVRSQGVAATAGELGRLDKAGRSAGAGLQKTEGHAKRASKSFSVLGSTAKLAGVTLGAAGLAKGLSLAVSEYREAQKVGAQTNAVLKSTGSAANVTKKHVQDLANAISLKSGIDDEAIQKGQNLLLTFRDIRNETGKGNKIFDQATQAITDVSVAMNQGMKQSAVQVGKALNDPIKGMTALKRIGVTFSDSQVAVVKHLVDTGDKLGAQRVILKELNKEFGGSAAAQATAGDKLKVAWNNLAEAAGGVLVPQLDKLAVFFTKVINQFVAGEGIAKFIIPAFLGIKSAVQAIATNPGVIKFFTDLKDAMVSLVTWATPIVENVAPKLVAFFKGLPGPVQQAALAVAGFALLFAVSGPLMIGITAFAVAAVLIKRNWSTIEPIIINVGAAITAWVTKNQADIAIVLKAFRDVGLVIKDVFQVAFPVALGIAKRAMEGARQAISRALQVLRGVVNVFLGLLHGDWSRVWGGLKDIAGGAIKGALGVLRVQTAAFREVGARMAGAVIDGLSMLGHTILNKFKDAANFVIKNVGDLFKGIGGAISKGVGKINPFGDGIGKLPVGGKGSAALMGASAALAPFANAGARFGLHVSSGLRPGAITTSGNKSYHSTGEAIDEAGPPAGMMAFFKYMKSNYGGRLAELIYGPGKIGIKNGQPFNFGPALNAQHMDHVHVALDTGKPGPGDGIGKRMRAAFMGDGYGIPQLEAIWMRAGGPKGAADVAAAVAMAESGGSSTASNRNKNGTIDRGLWQINSSHGAQSTFNPLANARAAVSISSGGKNWSPWTTFRTGAYKKFLGGGGTGRSAAKKAKKGAGISGGSSKAAKVGSKVPPPGTVPEGQEATFVGGKFAGYKSSAEIAAAQAHRDELIAAAAAEQDASDANTEAVNALNDQIAQLNAKIDLQTQLAQEALRKYNVSQSDYGTLSKALASIVSGEIGGKTGLGFMTPGFAGGGSRY